MQRETKTYIIDGKSMQFDSASFKELFESSKKRNGISVLEYETELGDSLCVSSNAVHNWRFGMNGPSDVETIKLLAEKMGLSNYMLLLKDGKEKNTVQVSERQKDSLKRVYDAVIDYLVKFDATDGFNNLWHKLCAEGIDGKRIEQMLYEIAEDEKHLVEVALEKEHIILHKLPFYAELEEFVYDGLADTYDGKLSYAYRFEAPVERIDGTCRGVTTDEDYAIALKRINSIMENCF